MTYPVTSNQRLECAALYLNSNRHRDRPVRLAKEAYNASEAFAVVPAAGTWLELAAGALLESGVDIGATTPLATGAVLEALGMRGNEFRFVHAESIALAELADEPPSPGCVYGANVATALRKLMALRK